MSRLLQGQAVSREVEDRRPDLSPFWVRMEERIEARIIRVSIRMETLVRNSFETRQATADLTDPLSERALGLTFNFWPLGNRTNVLKFQPKPSVVIVLVVSFSQARITSKRNSYEPNQ